MRRAKSLLSAALILTAVSVARADDFKLNLRSRVEADGKYTVATKEQTWPAKKTAIIVCDMWDAHHCLNAVRRDEEMAPRMNEFLTKARDRGVLIIHAPASCMEPYKDHPARKLAQAAPKADEPARRTSTSGASKIPAEEKGDVPDRPDRRRRGRRPGRARRVARQARRRWAATRRPRGRASIAGLTIDDEDAISDTGVEIWNLLEEPRDQERHPASACTRTCASSAGRSACGRWPRTARTSSWCAT